MKRPHLICVLEVSEALIFEANSIDYRLVEGDTFKHTVGGVTTEYKVEGVVLEVESLTGNPVTTSSWTTFKQRVTASIVP
jgi:hypothetical protein